MTSTAKPVKKGGQGRVRRANDPRLRKWEPRHELFAQAYCAGRTPGDAYLLAGQGDNSRNAYDWLKWPPMMARIKQISTERVHRLSLDRDKMILKLLDTYERASASDQHMAAVKCLDQLAKMLDLYPTEKQQLEVTLISKPAPEPTKQIELSVEDWREQFSPKEITQQ